ncbi:MAG: HDOD domain-containing protein [Campylobacterales bacterium]|nr:HDOD domain-containing protein [Campylobacterales bacterium]
MTFERIIKDIDSLPPLSNAANIIQAMYVSGLENINVMRLVKVIESDAMLTANILKMINAPYYGFSKKIASVAQAVSLFGTRRIHMLVIQYAIAQSLKADTSIYGFSFAQFNELCHLQSALMLQWYSKVELRDAQFIAPLALIMEAGKLVLANEVVKSDYCGEFRKEFNECEDINEFEKSLLGYTSYELSAILFEHWNLEPIYVDILRVLDIKDKEQFRKLDMKTRSYVEQLDIIRTAINAKEILTEESIKKASRKVGKMGLSRDSFEQTALRIRDSYFNYRGV